MGRKYFKKLNVKFRPIAKPKREIMNEHHPRIPNIQSYRKKPDNNHIQHPSSNSTDKTNLVYPSSHSSNQQSSLPPSSFPNTSSISPLPPPSLPPPPTSSLSTPPVIPPVTSVFTSDLFADLPIESRLRDSLAKSGFEKLTGIQKNALKNILEGCDTLVKSETGSGKTLCYLIPLLERLGKKEKRIERGDGTYAIVLCPTRELCIQVGILNLNIY